MDKRRQLIGNAMQLFVRHGINSVTMDELALASGVSKKTVYQFFENKAALVETVADLLIEKSKVIITKNSLNSADPVQELIMQQEFVKQWIGLRVIFSVLALRRYPRALMAFEEFKENYLKSIVEINLTKGIARGYYRPELNVSAAAAIYAVLADRFVFNGEGDYFEVMEAVLLFINGITTVDGRMLLEKYKTVLPQYFVLPDK